VAGLSELSPSFVVAASAQGNLDVHEIAKLSGFGHREKAASRSVLFKNIMRHRARGGKSMRANLGQPGDDVASVYRILKDGDRLSIPACLG
jgi:hypothetical protein